MTFNGWAVSLNGVMVTAPCDVEWDADLCTDQEVILGGMDGPPKGIGGLPGLRVEDQTYYQRDGVKHFSDWYLPRLVTITGTLENLNCTCTTGGCNCSDVRQQKRDLAQAWKRGCCDTELVIFPDCYQTDLATGLNEYTHGTFDVNADSWVGGGGATVTRTTTGVHVHSGAGALRIAWATDPGGDDTATGPTFTGTPGDSYQVSAWLQANPGQPMFRLGCSDVAVSNAVYADPVISDGTFHYTELTYVVPASGEVVPFVVSAEATTSGDLAYLDDVELKLVTPGLDRDLNGPFGLVGRPRVFDGDWDDSYQVFTYVARFDAVDQRMYVLDECGTPGYSSCETVNPGTQQFGLCTTGGEICVTTQLCADTKIVDGSVEPVEISVGGTEKVFPTITLYPPLIAPRVENITTGEFVSLATTLGEDDTPVTINTEDGTAFDADGNSLTYLLEGSLYLSMLPGTYEWRLVSNGVDVYDDPGYMTICWRDTVVEA